MAINLKDINELPVLDALQGTETVLVNDNGSAKAVSASAFGGNYDAVINVPVDPDSVLMFQDMECVEGSFANVILAMKEGKVPKVAFKFNYIDGATVHFPGDIYLYLAGADIDGTALEKDAVAVCTINETVCFNEDGYCEALANWW